MNKTYVHQEIEVKLTGRKAQKTAPGNKILELVEITPSNDYDGTWKKWVPLSTLFLIMDGPKET